MRPLARDHNVCVTELLLLWLPVAVDVVAYADVTKVWARLYANRIAGVCRWGVCDWV